MKILRCQSIRECLLILLVGSLCLGSFWDGAQGRRMSVPRERPRQKQADAIDLVGVLGLLHQYEERVLLVDVRPRPQYETGHIPYSCPAYPPSCTCELSQELLEQGEKADFVVALGVRGQDFSPFLAHFSQEARCPVFLYEGGISEWKGCGLPWEGEKTE